MRRSTYRLSRTGSIHRLRLMEEEIKPPGRNEVSIAVKAIGLNFADVFTILGLYRAAPSRDCVPGIEFAGEILECGEAVHDFSPGDRVMGSIRFGAFTTRLTIDQRYVLKLPEGWTYPEGAAFIVQALTAYYALVPLGNLERGQTVLIHSVVGGVGTYANRIAKLLGAFTIGTVGSPSKTALASEEGCDRVIVRGRGFRRDLQAALEGRPLDLVLDAVGGSVQKESFRQLHTTGRLVAYGLSEFASHRSGNNYFLLAWRYLFLPRYHTLTLIEYNKSVLGFNLIWLYDRVDALRRMLGEIERLPLARPRIGATLPFAQLKEAVRLLQSGTTHGKVVVTVDE